MVRLAEVHDRATSQELKEDKKQDRKDTKEGDGDKMEGNFGISSIRSQIQLTLHKNLFLGFVERALCL